MKKTFETPVVEKIEFCYQDQITASGDNCIDVWVNIGDGACTDGNPILQRIS